MPPLHLLMEYEPVSTRGLAASLQGKSKMKAGKAVSFEQVRRLFVAACLALVLTAATVWSGWSFLSRAARAVSQRQLIERQLEDIDRYWQAAKKQPRDTQVFVELKEAIRAATQDKEAADKAEAIAATAAGVLRKTIKDSIEKLSTEQSFVERLQGDFEAEFGRRIRLLPGPPPTYDAGPKPELLGPDKLRIAFDFWLGTGRSDVRYAKWFAAHQACRAYNAASVSLYPLIAQSEKDAEQAEQKQRAAAAALAECVRRLEDLGNKLDPFTESPPAIIPEIDRLRRRLAQSLPVLAVFGLSDLLAFVSCSAATALAWSRVALIANRFSPRQLSRA